MPFTMRLIGAVHIFTLLLICRAAPITNTTTPETYTVVSGDSLSTISMRFHSTLQALEACNPQVVDPALIQAGQVLSLPQPSSTSQTTSSSSKQTYTVVAGDNLNAIATKNNVPLDQLEAANPQITNPDFILPGLVINIPSSSSPSSSSDASSASGKYTIVQGDNLPSIARKLSTSLSALEAANPTIKDFNSFVAGQVLNTPATGGAASAQTGGSCGKLP